MHDVVVHEMNFCGTGLRFAIIASQYNNFVTEQLVRGAVEALVENGVSTEDIHIFWCPGGLEIPALAARIAQCGFLGKAFHGMVCCGCIIRGETDHYQFVAAEAMRGVADLAATARLAIGNAILTVANPQQAIERASHGSSNKGYEAALAALAMANHFRNLRAAE